MMMMIFFQKSQKKISFVCPRSDIYERDNDIKLVKEKEIKKKKKKIREKKRSATR